MAPFGVCEGPELYGGLWVPGVEDRPHELRDVGGRGERLGAIFGTFSCAVAMWFDEHQAPKGHPSGHKAECLHKRGDFLLFFIFPLVCFCDRVETSQIRI